MEKTKFIFDIGTTVFGVLAAFFAVLSLIYGSKIDAIKQIDEERLKTKIAESNNSAQKAKEEAANALFSASKTNNKAINLELKLEIQKKITADAEKELIILKNKIKPRSINVQNVNILIAELRKFSKKEINISSSLGDGEGLLYATQIKNVFESAGWRVNSGLGLSTYTGMGIYLISGSKNDTQVTKIKKLFTTCNIQFQEELTTSSTLLQIFVGTKNTQDLKSK